MSRSAFLAALRANLRGIAPKTADEIVADYASHFDEGLAEGRSEQDIAAGLGDPARLARELRAEAGLKRWDQERSVSAAAAAVLAILSLGAIDVLILFPVLLVVLSLMFAAACVAAAFVVAGIVIVLVSPFHGIVSGGFLLGLIGGIGFFSGGLSLGALVSLCGIGLTNLMIRFGRFHVRLIKPVAA
ncbi:MAG: hypothetical protein JWO72_1668 [Caulobacteraceae bacterium]|jgi:uncharacterized membrane protein|nr:hypothetical protein [Caulobacteraceae bacterium]